MANFERSQNEVVSAQDGMYVAPDPLLLEPRRIHLRHVYPNPAVVLQFRDWSNNRTAVIPPTGPTDGNVPILRLMNQGLITVHEDYLGTTRQLSSGQVLQYQVMDNPWIDYVLHRLKTGTTADLAPTANVNGTAAVSHQNVKVKLVFDGGTTPTADVTGWNRSIDPTSPYRGSWTQDSSYTGVAGNTEMDFISGYGEVYIQLTSITGSPTSVQVMISGAPA
jgi:hypothetical protein